MINNNWIRLGHTIINLDNIAYVDLDAVTYGGIAPCVLIAFTAVGPEGYEQTISFAGDDYAPVRAWLEGFLNSRIANGIYIPSQPKPKEQEKVTA